MAHLVDWRSAYREASHWITETTTWTPIQVSGKFKEIHVLDGKDCFYVVREISYDVYEVCKISLRGEVEVVLTGLKGYGTLRKQRGNVFWVRERNPVAIPVEHTTSYRPERSRKELTSWNSTPGVWKLEELSECEDLILSPDGTKIEVDVSIVGVYRNQPVPWVRSSYNFMVGPYHFIESGSKLRCRNLLRDGIPPPGRDQDESGFFTVMSRIGNGTFLYSSDRLYVLRQVTKRTIGLLRSNLFGK